MGFEPLVWYCRPVANGIWVTDSAFGAYTPCGIDTLVVCVSNLVLLGLSLWRVWLTIKDHKVRRYCLTSNWYNYLLVWLAGYCAATPVFRLVLGISIFDFGSNTTLAPFEVVSLIAKAFAWISLVTMIGMETKVYIREFQWYVRFGVVHALVGDAAMLNSILSVNDYHSRSVPYVYICSLLGQVLFGILILAHIPRLDPYPGYLPLRTGSLDYNQSEALLGGELICPERHTKIFSRIYFGWMTPLMQQGYENPITENDVWKLDICDRTETLSRKNFFWMDDAPHAARL